MPVASLFGSRPVDMGTVDPDEFKDWSIDYSDELDANSDTIAASFWTHDGSVDVGDGSTAFSTKAGDTTPPGAAFSGGITTVHLRFPTAGRYESENVIRCTSGRVYSRRLVWTCRER